MVDGYDMAGNGMVYGMAWQARYGTWNGLTDMAWYMLWPDGYGMWYVRLAGITRYIIWRGGHGMVYGMA